MRFVVRFGFLLFILGAMFWGDVLAFLELAEARDAAAVEESSEVVVPDASPAQEDRRDDARREFERLRRQNLAEADAEARWRAQENAAADREAELERLREEHLEPSGPMQRRTPPRPGRR